MTLAEKFMGRYGSSFDPDSMLRSAREEAGVLCRLDDRLYFTDGSRLDMFPGPVVTLRDPDPGAA